MAPDLDRSASLYLLADRGPRTVAARDVDLDRPNLGLRKVRVTHITQEGWREWVSVTDVALWGVDDQDVVMAWPDGRQVELLAADASAFMKHGRSPRRLSPDGQTWLDVEPQTNDAPAPSSIGGPTAVAACSGVD